ncbi:MAG: hypothetical protein AAGF55_11965 [Pseudomonadota bacterium]
MSLRPIAVFLVTATVLSGCATVSESRLNPFNWFGSSESSEAPAAAPVDVNADPRPLVEQVTGLTIEVTPSGAIIRATGLPPTQGWHIAELVAVNDRPVDGVLQYRFHAVAPLDPTPVSTVESRELRVADAISEAELAATRVIQVIGARNIQTVRR